MQSNSQNNLLPAIYGLLAYACLYGLLSSNHLLIVEPHHDFRESPFFKIAFFLFFLDAFAIFLLAKVLKRSNHKIIVAIQSALVKIIIFLFGFSMGAIFFAV